MADLSHVADATKKIVEIIAISIIALVLLFVVFQLGVFVKNIIAPAPPTPPTVTFGKLHAITFPQNIEGANYSYTVNTLTGSLPDLPDRITVYKLAQPAPNLLGLDKAKDLVAGLGFVDSPIALSDTSYRWVKGTPFPTTLTMDTQSFDFTITSQYQLDPSVTAATNLPSEEQAQTISAQFFGKIIPLPSSIDTSKTKTTLFSITSTGLAPATSLSNSQIIRVDYFPKSVDALPIYTSRPDQSLIYTLVAAGTADEPQVVEAQFYHKDITKSKATYPIKSANQALTELKQGKGYIAANPTGSTSVTITDVSLGYFVDATPQQYLWPIIVFQGDKGFYAYVSAIPDEWVQN